jgi:hypothetical protein
MTLRKREDTRNSKKQQEMALYRAVILKDGVGLS